jgi:glycosyltransferase involved in cell wall biosynthesis
MTDSKMPFITVVTPCLNDVEYLPEMIESFLAQDYPYKELFVQDGGSTDGTHEVLKRYPIRWTVAADSGPHDAINKAIRATHGDIILVMPANDLFAPGAFSRAMEELSARPELSMVYGDTYILEEDNTVRYIHRPGTLDVDRLFWTCCLMLQSSYIRREVFDRVGLFDEVITGPGDTEWFMRMVAGYPAESLLYVPEVWSSFRSDRSLRRQSSRHWIQGAGVLQNASEKFLSLGENCERLRQGEAHARAGMHCQCASWLTEADERGEAWKHFVKAFRLWPGLLLTSLGLNYTARVVLGRNLKEVVAKCMFRIRRVLRAHPVTGA